MVHLEIAQDRLLLGARFAVSFQRTLRIPDDGRTYPLPPGFGPFPIYRVADFADRVPTEWHEYGGVFIPMYQREALWLGFHAAAWKPNAVKVSVGRINAVSGETWDEELRSDPQNYIVCPDQPWLDGIAVSKGTIRQFVAMPLGMGYTVEGQVTGVKSKAMTSPCGKIRIPINESSDERSQIQEYLEQYHGEGIQHIALAANDIYATVDALRAQGVELLDTPETYYELLDSRLPDHGEPVEELKKRRILIDGSPSGGLLLQIFTQTMIGPIFFEIIQRKGDEGFGEGNFKALFESMELDQVRRGVLKIGVRARFPLASQDRCCPGCTSVLGQERSLA